MWRCVRPAHQTLRASWSVRSNLTAISPTPSAELASRAVLDHQLLPLPPPAQPPPAASQSPPSLPGGRERLLRGSSGRRSRPSKPAPSSAYACGWGGGGLNGHGLGGLPFKHSPMFWSRMHLVQPTTTARTSRGDRSALCSQRLSRLPTAPASKPTAGGSGSPPRAPYRLAGLRLPAGPPAEGARKGLTVGACAASVPATSGEAFRTGRRSGWPTAKGGGCRLLPLVAGSAPSPVALWSRTAPPCRLLTPACRPSPLLPSKLRRKPLEGGGPSSCSACWPHILKEGWAAGRWAAGEPGQEPRWLGWLPKGGGAACCAALVASSGDEGWLASRECCRSGDSMDGWCSGSDSPRPRLAAR